MELFKAISSGTFKSLTSLADAFFERQNMPAALLSLDYHFSEPQALQMCRRAKALFPCPLHVLGGCLESDLCTRDHIEPNQVWYNTWLQAHIYQVLIYQTINRNGLNYHSASRDSERAYEHSHLVLD